MLEHDLEYTSEERYECINCRAELIHLRVGFDDDHFENYGSVLVMKCRVCEKEGRIPASHFDTGVLSQLVVRR